MHRHILTQTHTNTHTIASAPESETLAFSKFLMLELVRLARSLPLKCLQLMLAGAHIFPEALQQILLSPEQIF